ncbi:MAG: hypothetical protein JXR84_11815 [Anaerolineae bacterium]|nr:hypothetical protein [Anaerolineae bacterium]
MNHALPPALLSDLKKTLRATEYFDSDARLTTLFVDERIVPWRYRCTASSSKGERVDFLITLLHDNYNTEGDNALILFLEVLKDEYTTQDAMHDKIKRLIRRLKRTLGNGDSQSSNIPFVNREAELDKIKGAEQQTQYWLIYAPQGYGKTTFLNQITQHYLNKNWVCAQVEISKKHPPELCPLVAITIHALGEEITFEKGAKLEAMGLKLATCILRHPLPDNENKLAGTHDYGAALVFDNMDALDQNTLESLAIVIGYAHRDLWDSGFFKANHRFCLLMGSRDGRTVKESFKRHGIPVNDLGLSPYTYKYVRETLDHYINKVNDILRLVDGNSVEHFAAQLMYYGGGHPGCIAALLVELVDRSFAGYTRILEDGTPITKSVFDVLNDFERTLPDPGLLPILETLSVFRRIDFAMLSFLIERCLIPSWHESANKLDIELSQTHLERDEEAYLKDSIAQRLLLIRFRMTEPAAFADICQTGIVFYQQRLGEYCPNPVSDAIEYLYLCIHEACHIENQCVDDLQRTIAAQLECVATWFMKVWGPYHGPRLIRQLGQRLSDDWELEFLANYFLSPGQYRPMPFYKIIDDFNKRYSIYTG